MIIDKKLMVFEERNMRGILKNIFGFLPCFHLLKNHFVDIDEKYKTNNYFIYKYIGFQNF